MLKREPLVILIGKSGLESSGSVLSLLSWPVALGTTPRTRRGSGPQPRLVEAHHVIRGPALASSMAWEQVHVLSRPRDESRGIEAGGSMPHSASAPELLVPI